MMWCADKNAAINACRRRKLCGNAAIKLLYRTDKQQTERQLGDQQSRAPKKKSIKKHLCLISYQHYQTRENPLQSDWLVVNWRKSFKVSTSLRMQWLQINRSVGFLPSYSLLKRKIWVENDTHTDLRFISCTALCMSVCRRFALCDFHGKFHRETKDKYQHCTHCWQWVQLYYSSRTRQRKRQQSAGILILCYRP